MLAAAIASFTLVGPQTFAEPFGPAVAADGQVIAELAIDADYEFFVLNGMSVDATLAAIEAVINDVAQSFEDGPGVIFDVTAVVIRTDPNDPYTSSDAATLFQQVRSEWLNNQPHAWDAVQLFTGKNLNGAILGMAGLDSICTTNAVSLVANNGLPAIGKSHLSARQLGFIFGASTCSDAPDCGVMCSSYFGCDGDPLIFGQQAIDDIQVLVADQGDCLEPACAADCDGDGALTILDFICFQTLFLNGDPGADCDGNGVLNVLDFVCYQGAFSDGCG